MTVCFCNWGVVCLPDTSPKDDPLLEVDAAVCCLEAAVSANHASFTSVPAGITGPCRHACGTHAYKHNIAMHTCQDTYQDLF